MHLIKPKAEWVEVPDFYQDDGSVVLIALDPSLSAGENVEAYYKKYQKPSVPYRIYRKSLRQPNTNWKLATAKYEALLLPNSEGVPDINLLRKASGGGPLPDARKDPFSGAPGLRFQSGAYTILVGRNAKENDGLLRKWTRGNDCWMHTRDVPGGYVLSIHCKKTIPLESL